MMPKRQFRIHGAAGEASRAIALHPRRSSLGCPFGMQPRSVAMCGLRHSGSRTGPAVEVDRQASRRASASGSTIVTTLRAGARRLNARRASSVLVRPSRASLASAIITELTTRGTDRREFSHRDRVPTETSRSSARSVARRPSASRVNRTAPPVAWAPVSAATIRLNCRWSAGSTPSDAQTVQGRPGTFMTKTRPPTSRRIATSRRRTEERQFRQRSGMSRTFR